MGWGVTGGEGKGGGGGGGKQEGGGSVQSYMHYSKPVGGQAQLGRQTYCKTLTYTIKPGSKDNAFPNNAQSLVGVV